MVSIALWSSFRHCSFHIINTPSVYYASIYSKTMNFMPVSFLDPNAPIRLNDLFKE